jgi:hypothetical protein
MELPEELSQGHGVDPSSGGDQPHWPSGSCEAVVKLKPVQAFCPERPSPPRSSCSGKIDAGAETHYHPAGDDPRRGH